VLVVLHLFLLGGRRIRGSSPGAEVSWKPVSIRPR
jgi:hypothetical protein